jgi:hypothetical protein
LIEHIENTLFNAREGVSTEKEGKPKANGRADGGIDEEPLDSAIQSRVGVQLSRKAALHLLLGHFESFCLAHKNE